MSSEVIFLSELSHAIGLESEMTSRTQILTAKQLVKKSIPRSQVVRIIDGDDELKNIAGRVLKYNSKN